MTQKTERSNYDQQAPFKEIWHESPVRDGLGVSGNVIAAGRAPRCVFYRPPSTPRRGGQHGFGLLARRRGSRRARVGAPGRGPRGRGWRGYMGLPPCPGPPPPMAFDLPNHPQRAAMPALCTVPHTAIRIKLHGLPHISATSPLVASLSLLPPCRSAPWAPRCCPSCPRASPRPRPPRARSTSTKRSAPCSSVRSIKSCTLQGLLTRPSKCIRRYVSRAIFLPPLRTSVRRV